MGFNDTFAVSSFRSIIYFQYEKERIFIKILDIFSLGRAIFGKS